MEYLFALPQNIVMLMLVETHRDETYTKSQFNKRELNVTCSPPEATNEMGTHGGELIAVKQCIKSTNINTQVDSYFKERFPMRRFAARIVNFRSLDVLVVTVYLWCSEGFTERNNALLQQILLLKNFLKLPIILLSDFNIQFSDFMKSEWPQKFNACSIHPQVPTTITTNDDRIIDFGLLSKEIQLMIKSIQPIHSVVWGPHIALLITLFASPRSIFRYVQGFPKALPMSDFNKAWNKLSLHGTTAYH